MTLVTFAPRLTAFVLLNAAALAWGQGISRSFVSCALPTPQTTVQAALDDPLAQYAIVRSSNRLVRFDGPSGSVNTLHAIEAIDFRIAASNGNAIYMTGRESVFPASAALYRSLDRGASWVAIQPCPLPIFAVSADGVHLVVGPDCSVFTTTPRVSHDRGQTWQQFGSSLFTGDALAFSNASPQVIYIARGLFGVSQSNDGGTTFQTRANRGFMTQLGTQLATDWRDPSTLYVVTYGNSGFHFQYSTNGGDDWTMLPSYPGSTTFSLSPNVAGRIYASGSAPGQIFRSDDNGRTWRTLPVTPGVTATCNADDRQISGLSVGSTTPLYPENALLILIESDAPLSGGAAVPISRNLLPWLAGFLICVALASMRRRAKT